MVDSPGCMKGIFYFDYCGEVNTEHLLRLTRLRCEELDLKKVIIASETGRSAIRALEEFRNTRVRLIIVTHYPATTWGPRGEILIGLLRPEYAEELEKLKGSGARIVQGTRPLAPPSRSISWSAPTPEAMVDKSLEIFGAGSKIAIEAALMATDSGEVDEGEDVISCAGTYKGLDTALVVRACFSMNFFRDFEIREIIARPVSRVRELPEYSHENWRGDLDKYYSRVP